jgi:plastocyanin
MKTKLATALLPIILLAACSPKAAPTPSATLPPIVQPPATTAPTSAPTAAPTSAPLSGSVEATIAGFTFSPAELTIKVGTTVTWKNEDSATHTVSADDDSWGSNQLEKGDSFSFTFNQAGTFSYHCGVHRSMKGTITVVP